MILLLDNVSCHHSGIVEVEFDGNFFQTWVSESLLVDFIPPNMTSTIQPMDMGIIASFKANYRRFL